jgi:hypothetical protein
MPARPTAPVGRRVIEVEADAMPLLDHRVLEQLACVVGPIR